MDYGIIKDNIKRGVYSNKVECPQREPIKPNVSKDSECYEAINREYSIKLQQYIKEVKEFQNGKQVTWDKFEEDVLQMMFEIGISKNQVRVAYVFAIEHYKSEGFVKVLDYIAEICSMLTDRNIFWR